MVVDPLHRYSNEAKRANLDIYDDFKLKNTFRLYKNISALQGLNVPAVVLPPQVSRNHGCSLVMTYIPGRCWTVRVPSLKFGTSDGIKELLTENQGNNFWLKCSLSRGVIHVIRPLCSLWCENRYELLKNYLVEHDQSDFWKWLVSKAYTQMIEKLESEDNRSLLFFKYVFSVILANINIWNSNLSYLP